MNKLVTEAVIDKIDEDEKKKKELEQQNNKDPLNHRLASKCEY